MAKFENPRTRTFTQQARRAQIVQAAIETVAELGYSNASLQNISKHAGLSSTGMISYHFTGKPELLTEMVNTIFDTARTVTAARIGQEETYRGKLGAYIRSHVDFIVRYPVYTRALVEIVTTCRHQRITGLDDLERHVLSVEHLVDLLENGRKAGEFGTFDSFTMAVAIRGAIEYILRHRLLDGDLDLDRCGQELVEAFDRCTQPM
ncbi:TetR/AcrR family transcriptional regulator [Streptomyces sp. TP-A0356]|uniref:TetR/AcrR family transcriptional regulator n=1 Tax=Streptomyces sp. TP-A0356 TaxID=1359208 RepID=UPI0006E1F114|nr:TetR family transcriptional regulator [Streptomyces sp. TP-A0356]